MSHSSPRPHVRGLRRSYHTFRFSRARVRRPVVIQILRRAVNSSVVCSQEHAIADDR
jgi:hypothetical protein